jgi:hypothetical protein
MKRHLLKVSSIGEDEKLNTTTSERRESITNKSCFGFMKKKKSNNTTKTYENELNPVRI